MSSTEAARTAPVATVSFAPPAVDVTDIGGGGMILKSPMVLKPHASSVGDYLRHWAQVAPDRVFLAERADPTAVGGPWRKVTYAQARAAVESIGQALLDRDASVEHPVMVLSDNGVDNGLLQLACMYVGVPCVPVSPAYSLMSQDHAKLGHIFDLIEPSMIFVANGEMFAGALGSLDLSGVELVVSTAPSEGVQSTPFAELLDTDAGTEVETAFASVGPDTVAKILFTSGSTGMPKGVINTQRMLCSNQQAIVQLWPFLEEKPPVTVDWLPWNHTFGGNHNFNLILRNGGTMYVDGGKPAPGIVERTVANLAEVSPTIYFNVPRGFDVLLGYLEKDTALRDNFFKDLEVVFYAAAALPQPLWERLEVLSVAATGKKVQMVSSWGATETAPMVTSVHWTIDRAGVIGLPAPGIEVKMVPNGSKMELRVRGPNITPGYYKNPDQTKAAFDEDGFYCIGDAGKFADPNDPVKGLVFDGRTAEDFKLTSGTWVAVGNLRMAAIGAAPSVIQDCVITGHDREEVGLLIFPNVPGIKALCPDAPADLPLADLLARDEVRAELAKGMAAHNAVNTGGSMRLTRAILMTAPPAIDENEITDKGYVNQRAVLECRADFVTALYGDADAVIYPAS